MAFYEWEGEPYMYHHACDVGKRHQITETSSLSNLGVTTRVVEPVAPPASTTPSKWPFALRTSISSTTRTVIRSEWCPPDLLFIEPRRRLGGPWWPRPTRAT
jgi:hypothetical protein